MLKPVRLLGSSLRSCGMPSLRARLHTSPLCGPWSSASCHMSLSIPVLSVQTESAPPTEGLTIPAIPVHLASPLTFGHIRTSFSLGKKAHTGGGLGFHCCFEWAPDVWPRSGGGRPRQKILESNWTQSPAMRPRRRLFWRVLVWCQ